MIDAHKIPSLYSRYFQKSKTFLLPFVLTDRKSMTQPENVYIAWKDRYTVKDKRLIVVYKARNKSAAFKKAEAVLTASPLFESREEYNDKIIFIFNFTKKKRDWKCFIDGKYSMLDEDAKLDILYFFRKEPKECTYINSYLYPEYHFDHYASLLDVDVRVLLEVGELCDKYDQDRETLTLVTEDLEILEKAI